MKLFNLNKIFVSGLFYGLLLILTCTPGESQGQEINFWQTDLFVSGENGVANYRIPSLVTTKKGTLLAVCDARVDRPGDLPNNIDLTIRRSQDNGATWSAPKIIVDYPNQEGGGDPCMIVNGSTGEIWLFYVYGAGGVGINTSKQGLSPDSTLQLYAITSADDGITWTESRNLTADLKDPEWFGVFFASGRGLQTSNGTMIVPLMVRKTFGTRENDHAHVAYSQDQGKTWKTGESAGILMGESKVVELTDGRIMINMRSKHKLGQRAVNYSEDHGQTWGDYYHDSQLIEPACNASIIGYVSDNLNENILLFSNPASTKSRKKMSVRLSRDDGKSWSEPKLIYDGRSAYSSMTVLANGNIGLLYERDRKITFAKFSLEWLTGDF